MADHRARAAEVVGHACEFLDDVKELQTECSICLHVLRDPHMVECCGYRFCGSCIQKVLRDFNTCPLCNHFRPRVIADKQLSRSLREKKVKCTYHENGCQWVGELSSLDEHLDLSRRMSRGRFSTHLLCKYCNGSYQRRHVEAHESKCLKRPIICEYCNVFQCLSHEIAKHLEECGHYPVICPKGCGATITRISLNKHVKNWCSFTIVECEYAYAGCDVKMPRKDVKDHAEQSMSDHLSLLTKKCAAMKLELENEKLELEEEKRKAESFKSMMRTELAREREKNRALQAELDKVKQQMTREEDDIHLLKKLCNLKAEGDYFSQASDQVLIVDLPERATDQMVKGLFGQHGSVYRVAVYYNTIALVEYEDNDSLRRMFRKYNSTGIRLLGCQLRCVQMMPTPQLRARVW